MKVMCCIHRRQKDNGSDETMIFLSFHFFFSYFSPSFLVLLCYLLFFFFFPHSSWVDRRSVASIFFSVLLLFLSGLDFGVILSTSTVFLYHRFT